MDENDDSVSTFSPLRGTAAKEAENGGNGTLPSTEDGSDDENVALPSRSYTLPRVARFVSSLTAPFRFSHSRNVAHLLSPYDGRARQDYRLGLASVAGIPLAFFAAWGAVLLYFHRRRGRRRRRRLEDKLKAGVGDDGGVSEKPERSPTLSTEEGADGAAADFSPFSEVVGNNAGAIDAAERGHPSPRKRRTASLSSASAAPEVFRFDDSDDVEAFARALSGRRGGAGRRRRRRRRSSSPLSGPASLASEASGAVPSLAPSIASASTGAASLASEASGAAPSLAPSVASRPAAAARTRGERGEGRGSSSSRGGCLAAARSPPPPLSPSQVSEASGAAPSLAPSVASQPVAAARMRGERGEGRGSSSRGFWVAACSPPPPMSPSPSAGLRQQSPGHRRQRRRSRSQSAPSLADAAGLWAEPRAPIVLSEPARIRGGGGGGDISVGGASSLSPSHASSARTETTVTATLDEGGTAAGTAASLQRRRAPRGRSRSRSKRGKPRTSSSSIGPSAPGGGNASVASRSATTPGAASVTATTGLGSARSRRGGGGGGGRGRGSSERRGRRRRRRRLQRALRRRIADCRAATIFFGVALSGSVVVLVLYGLPPMRNAARAMGEGAEDASSFAADAASFSDAFRLAADSFDEDTRGEYAAWDDMEVLCPSANFSDNGTIIGLNVSAWAMSDALDGFDAFNGRGGGNWTAAEGEWSGWGSGASRAGERLDEVAASLSKSARLGWIVPTFLMLLCASGAAVVAGSIWENSKNVRSAKRAERAMSRAIMPAFIAFMIACLAALAVAALGSTINNDACTAGIAQGSPDVTIVHILDEWQMESTHPHAYAMVKSYTEGCRDGNPLEFLLESAENMTASVNAIWDVLLQMNTVGIEELNAKCGAAVDGAFESAWVLANGMSASLAAIQSAEESLSCDMVGPVYVGAVRNAACSGLAHGLSMSFLILSIASLCGMLIFTLRCVMARHRDKLRDLNKDRGALPAQEHDEYMSFISQYQHEWDEYPGFDAESVMSASVTDAFSLITPTTPDLDQVSYMEDRSEASEQDYDDCVEDDCDYDGNPEEQGYESGCGREELYAIEELDECAEFFREERNNSMEDDSWEERPTRSTDEFLRVWHQLGTSGGEPNAEFLEGDEGRSLSWDDDRDDQTQDYYARPRAQSSPELRMTNDITFIYHQQRLDSGDLRESSSAEREAALAAQAICREVDAASSVSLASSDASRRDSFSSQIEGHAVRCAVRDLLQVDYASLSSYDEAEDYAPLYDEAEEREEAAAEERDAKSSASKGEEEARDCEESTDQLGDAGQLRSEGADDDTLSSSSTVRRVAAEYESLAQDSAQMIRGVGSWPCIDEAETKSPRRRTQSDNLRELILIFENQQGNADTTRLAVPVEKE